MRGAMTEKCNGRDRERPAVSMKDGEEATQHPSAVAEPRASADNEATSSERKNSADRESLQGRPAMTPIGMGDYVNPSRVLAVRRGGWGRGKGGGGAPSASRCPRNLGHPLLRMDNRSRGVSLHGGPR